MSQKLEIARDLWVPPKPEAYTPYLKPSSERGPHPEIKPDQLVLDFVWGDTREQLRLLSAGDASLLLQYRKRNGYMSSFQEAGEDLEILQLQGAKQEGYRVTQGVNVVRLMADHIWGLAINPDAPFQRITMAHPHVLTENMSSIASHNAVLRIPNAVDRYNTLIAYLGMTFSEIEGKYIAEIQL